MTQTAYMPTRGDFAALELPDANDIVIDDVLWGKVEELLTPASWAFQCLAQMDSTDPHRFRMGDTLEEEFAVCMLAGYGVPAEIGMAAADRLRDAGVLDGSSPSGEGDIAELLRRPLDVDGRSVRYRFYKTKARYLSEGLAILRGDRPNEQDPIAFRAWFRKLPGVGPKTSSFITRNWLGSDDVAILDIHVVRACQAFGLFKQEADVTKEYAVLEEKFVQFSRALGVKASWLDAVMWDSMRLLSGEQIAELAPLSPAGDSANEPAVEVESERPAAAQRSLFMS